MLEEKPKLATILLLAGTTLMFINALLVGINGGPLITSSYTLDSPNDALGSKAQLWIRVSFGFKGWVEGLWSIFWIITAVAMLYCTVRLYVKPLERKNLCLVIATFSTLSFMYGGGFMIGAILGILGAGIGYSWPIKLQKAFFYKIIQAAKLDSSFFQGLKNNEDSLKHAAYGLVLANILTGIGGGLYTYSAQQALAATSSNIPFRTILLGEIPIDVSLVTTIAINAGLGMLKWITLSLIIYVVAIGLQERKQTLAHIAAATAFAYIPISLQVFMPFVMTSTPYLNFTWPFLLTVLTNLWMVLALVVGIRQTLEISLDKTLGILCLSGAAYILLRETFYSTLAVPNLVEFAIQPQVAVLAIVSSLAIGSVLFGAFSKR